MSTDLTTQLRDYLDSVTPPITSNEIVDGSREVVIPSASEIAPPGGRTRRGPLAAVLAATVVLIFGGIALLMRPNQHPVVTATDIVDEVFSHDSGPAHVVVGFDADGFLCAWAGSAHEGNGLCGGEGLTVVGFQAFSHIAVAGFVPANAAEVTVLYDGARHPVDLVPTPGRDSLAFASIEEARPRTVEVEVRDDQGALMSTRPVSVGTISDDLGWKSAEIPGAVQENLAVVSTGSELIFSDGYTYEPDSDTWVPLPQRPVSLYPATTGVWTGTEAIFCCALRSDVQPMWAYSPGSGSWRELSSPPVDLAPPLQSVWTGEEMLVMTELEAATAAYDPERDQWRVFDEAPIGLGVSTPEDRQVVWTGSEMMVLSIDGQFAALDLESGAWRILPEPPLEYGNVDSVAYTGTELLVWSSGAYDPEAGSFGTPAFMFDPEGTEWSELPSPVPDSTTCGCRLVGGQTITWTGESMFVSTTYLRSIDEGNADPLVTDVMTEDELGRSFHIAYHPDDGRWSYEGVSPMGRDGWWPIAWEESFIVGDRVILRSAERLYVSPPGWQPDGPPIPVDDLLSGDR